ncbi:MAG TPA: hypothetical protein VEH04_11245 [Verrucomicrobiae bacterium]|nr:hypothetical protein [Verrucomicrobiae bacterium]
MKNGSVSTAVILDRVQITIDIILRNHGAERAMAKKIKSGKEVIYECFAYIPANLGFDAVDDAQSFLGGECGALAHWFPSGRFNAVRWLQN